MGQEAKTVPESKQQVRCPNCGWNNVRVSYSHRALDKLAICISLRPFRCRSCGKRFYRFSSTPREKTRP